MPKDLIAGNWKMHASHLDAIQMIQKLSYRLEPSDHARVDVVVCPPFTALRSAQTVIETDHLLVKLGAQDVHWEEEGAYTGAIAAPMLQKLSVDYVIVGHSERRQLFGETDDDVNRKLKAVLHQEMTPILCVGETLEEREQGITNDRIGSQVRLGLKGLDAGSVEKVVVAYEPIWAIGTGKTADADIAGDIATFIRTTIAEQWPDAAAEVPILYGGSVKPGNIAGFMAKRDVNGALVGGAALDPDSFASIVRYWM
ncbi:MAG: triose-phosphate isomerase [Acidimicrobiia bacterium]|nr:triose-phosphate isomerase [Acidimicrobiia bacterium]NNK92132.1 triose-phosphate isomerase [Acidimicrobiia bacterium]